MKYVLAALLVLHGLIHLMGFFKAFGLAELPQLAGPISRPMGVLWLSAGLLTVVAAGLLFAVPRWWWLAGLASVLLSQAVIISSWSDARFGTVANAVTLVAVVLTVFLSGPASLHAEYERRVQAGLQRSTPQPLVTEADLAPLPELVAKYLRRSGVVGSRGCTTSPRAGTAASAPRRRARGCPSRPSSTTSSTRRRGCSR